MLELEKFDLILAFVWGSILHQIQFSQKNDLDKLI